MSSISPILSGFQGDCKMTAERTAQGKEHRYKMEIGMPSFSPVFSLFVGLSKESVLFSKSSLSICYSNMKNFYLTPLTLQSFELFLREKKSPESDNHGQCH
jgi:hypothetical protein